MVLLFLLLSLSHAQQLPVSETTPAVYCGTDDGQHFAQFSHSHLTKICIIQAKSIFLGVEPIQFVRFYYGDHTSQEYPLLAAYPDQKMGWEMNAYVLKFAISDINRKRLRLSYVYLAYRQFAETLSLENARFFGNTLDGIPFNVEEFGSKTTGL